MAKSSKPAPVPTYNVEVPRTVENPLGIEERPVTVGMGVTEGVGSDAYPYEVVRIFTERKIAVRRMRIEALPSEKPLNYGEAPEYVYHPQPEAGEIVLRKTSYGRWQSAGGGRFYPGSARYYQDPSF